MTRNWRCGGVELGLDSPLVMGVLNVTPDSFSDGGSYAGVEAAVEAGLRMVQEGAAIIDVGGESTRPGSDEVASEEELRRVIPVVEGLAAAGAIVSVDTRHPEVASRALEAGAHILNDITGLTDPRMLEIAAASDCGLVVMHMKGEPKTMQAAPAYDDAACEIEKYLLDRTAALEEVGIAPERIAIDPGPGFGKITDHDYDVLRSMEALAAHGYPVVAAVSRKRLLGDVTGLETPRDRDAATAYLTTRLAVTGARILRVHDVTATVSALRAERALDGPSVHALVALGSNMGDRIAHLREARRAVGALPLTRVISASSIHETEPAYHEDHDVFANAILMVETRLESPVLLARILGIEDGMGRVRTQENGPRIIDLDLLTWGDARIRTERLTVPHPRIGERDFVLVPLAEVVADPEEFLAAHGIESVPPAERVGAVARVLADPDGWVGSPDG